MRRWLKRVGVVVMVLAVIALAIGIWKREEVLRLMAVNSLTSPARVVANFSNMDALFYTADMDGGTASPLAAGNAATLPQEFLNWVRERHVTAAVVLSEGVVVFEDYYQGTSDTDRRISWSMAKSVLSLLLGILHDEGIIPDLDAMVTDYAPDLRGSAYDGASIRNVLQMASGIAFNEDYFDYFSDINRMGRVIALGGSMDGFAVGQTGRRGDPGGDWLYVSIDTHVLGMVIRGATGHTIPDLISDRILRPLGLESDPYYVTDGDGVAFVLGGLNMMTRDYARIGLMVAQGGQWQGQQLVPTAWIDTSTVASAPNGAGYGYQWWIPDNAEPGEVYAWGYYGQYIWIDRARNVVIAVNSTDPGFEEPENHARAIEMFRTISRQLAAAE